MEVSASAKRLRISAQKVRLVADQIRGKPVAEALDLLSFSTQKASALMRKELNFGRAEQTYTLDRNIRIH